MGFFGRKRGPESGPPPGKVRGLARMVAGEQQRSEDDLASERWHGVVMEVAVPGRDLYKVEMGSLRLKRYDVAEKGYPVLVDETDPNDVEILFDEMPDTEAAAGQLIQERFQSAMAGIGAAEGDAIVASLNAVTDPEQRRQLAERLRAMGYEVPPDA